MMEEAIALSGANDEGRKLFLIGVNCDADSSFNKDPKDPNKYEQEGQKMQFDEAQMVDYFSKLINEHPLLVYFEDAFSQFDFKGHNALKNRLTSEFPQVKMGLRQLFTEGGIKRVKLVTEHLAAGEVPPTREESVISKEEASKQMSATGTALVKNQKTPEKSKRTPPSNVVNEVVQNDFPEPDPSDPNKHKVVPDFISLNMQNSQIPNMTALLHFFKHQSQF
mmetsp:Transcript_14956/g.25459  ORF Transcript_14956/g.25459 Transcript_14956/m.25459 type:complete len:222 (+) Transcript_14956:745-1410(+)